MDFKFHSRVGCNTSGYRHRDVLSKLWPHQELKFQVLTPLAIQVLGLHPTIVKYCAKILTNTCQNFIEFANIRLHFGYILTIFAKAWKHWQIFNCIWKIIEWNRIPRILMTASPGSISYTGLLIYQETLPFRSHMDFGKTEFCKPFHPIAYTTEYCSYFRIWLIFISVSLLSLPFRSLALY